MSKFGKHQQALLCTRRIKMLNVSEYFYSIQGEGEYQGHPAVFFRVQGCNLFCGRPKIDDLTKKADNAKWVCDTIGVWMKGKPLSYKEIYDGFEEQGINKHLKEGAHLVLTGGEPLLQQDNLVELVNYISEHNKIKPFVEVETNGTLLPNDSLDKIVDRYNVSPKLSNSANPKDVRYKENSIKYHCVNDKSIFKFVTLDKEDTKEIMNDFINKFDIPKNKIWLMPGAYNREELWKNGQVVAELCKEHGYKMSSRLHVEIWDRLTGV